MSRRFTWGILIVLVGLLYASWWAVFQNQYQGAKEYVENEKISRDAEMKEAMDKKNLDQKKGREQIQQVLKGKQPAATAVEEVRKSTKPVVPVDEPYIKADWFRKHGDGSTGLQRAAVEQAQVKAAKERLATGGK